MEEPYFPAKGHPWTVFWYGVYKCAILPPHTPFFSFFIWGYGITFVVPEVCDIAIILQISYMNLNEAIGQNNIFMAAGRRKE